VISEKAYLVILVLIGGERIFELLLSRRNARRAFARGAVEVKQRHYPFMVAFHSLFLVSCAAESLLWQHNFPPIVAWGALAFAVLAQALRYAAVWTLGDRWNTKVIVEPGEQPVATGLYRWIRHPNYVAIALEIVAIPMIRGAWITALAFSVANLPLLAVRISVEERALGETYAKAFASRPRFIPKLSVATRDSKRT
jgi:methyltransferase